MSKTKKVRHPYAKALREPKYRQQREDNIKLIKRKIEDEESQKEIQQFRENPAD